GHGNVPRFLNERQILARLDHPGIARLYDGGVTAEGQPYFALELVDGEPITVAAERRAMSVEQRLKLFGDVCGAVAYAHQRLVVHRDLKPSNVFVTEDGEVRLLDFGIAKLLDAAEADLTTTGAAPRTPAYAAPEQIRGEPVTTATDVYALGVLLYELLTGKRPYALDERARAAIERAILHTEPTVPSDAVTQTASGSATAAPAAPDRLAKRLRGDLDQIVLKALRKEPAARYGSAEAFAADIARHLAGDVVEARPLGVLYRMRRLARRHRAVLGVAVLGVALLVGWAVTATVQGQRVAAERDRAEALNRVLVDLFESVDPTTGGDRGLTVSEFLSSATDRLQRDLTERPALQAELLSVLAASHLGLGDHTSADSVASLAASAAASLPPGHQARTLARSWYAWTRTYHGDYETSEQIYRSLLTEATAQDRPTVETDFAMVLAEMGNEDEALAMYQQAVGALRPLSRRNSTRRRDLASALDGLSTLYASRWTAEGYERAWSLQDEAVRIKSEVWGAGHPQTAEAVSELAGLAAARNDLPTADSLFARSVGILEAAYGSEHPTVATVLNNWALARANGGDHDGSEPLHLRALAVREAVYGEQHQSTAASIQNLAALYSLMPGREADALALYERAQRAYDASLPDGHYLRAFPVAGRANVLRQLGRSADAVREARRAVDLLAESLGPDHTATIETRGTLGLALASMGRDAEAEEHLRAALARDPDDETRRRLVSALRGR
ncbi:MAG: serine/threonine-protein kinase, partial [Bacteroidota bacterium]